MVEASHGGPCLLCKDSHIIYQCPKFAQKNIKQLLTFLGINIYV